jgi:hypothetical protein
MGLGAGAAEAQSNLDAGKSAAQIFANTCQACHRSPREIKRSSESFLRSHYTASREEAATMAAYLASIPSDPRAVEQRRPPAAKQAPAAENAKPPSEGGTRARATPATEEQPKESPKEGPKPAQGQNRRPSRHATTEPKPAPQPEPPPPAPAAATPPPPVLPEMEE